MRTCPCCGYKTIPNLEEYNICPICFWEDDFDQAKNPSLYTGTNGKCLIEAQLNYLKYGVYNLNYINNIRKPYSMEIKDNSWKPVIQLDELYWELITNDKNIYVDELHKKINQKHILYKKDVVEIAKRKYNNDILFMYSNEHHGNFNLAIVNLSISDSKNNESEIPSCRIYYEFADFNILENF